MWVSELLPHTSKIVGELSFVRSVWTEAINHDPAITYICTGNQLPGRASLGAWLGFFAIGLVIINREDTELDDIADLVINAEIGATMSRVVGVN